MVEMITRARHIAARDIFIRLGFSERVTVPGSDTNYFDHDLDEDLCVGLRDYPLVNVIKVMGDICKRLFQNKRRMVAIGLFTNSQYESGVI